MMGMGAKDGDGHMTWAGYKIGPAIVAKAGHGVGNGTRYGAENEVGHRDGVEHETVTADCG